MTDFERQLQGQRFCEFARHWRDEILDKTEAAVRAAELGPSKIAVPWLKWLWPSPVAWLSLAAVWMFLIVIDCSDRPVMVQSAASIARPAAGQNALLFAFKTRDDIDGLPPANH